jgi:hypothetical protein
MARSDAAQQGRDKMPATVPCPDCGDLMPLVFRCLDTESLHAWFECPLSDCTGHLLVVRPVSTAAAAEPSPAAPCGECGAGAEPACVPAVADAETGEQPVRHDNPEVHPPSVESSKWVLLCDTGS